MIWYNISIIAEFLQKILIICLDLFDYPLSNER